MNSLPSNTEIKRAWCYTSASLICRHGVDRDNLYLLPQTNWNVPSVISGFRRVVNKIFALLACYAAHGLVIYWSFGITYRSLVIGQEAQVHCLSFEVGTDRLFRNVQNNYQSTLRSIPEEWRCQNVPTLWSAYSVPSMFPVITSLKADVSTEIPTVSSWERNDLIILFV